MSLPKNQKMPVEREALANHVREKIRTAINEVLANQIIISSCISCINFDEPSEICKVFKQRPPARIIAHGCPEYVDAYDIPY
jgi:hypothetical protein